MGTSTANQFLPPLPPLPHFLHNALIHSISHFRLQTLYTPAFPTAVPSFPYPPPFHTHLSTLVSLPSALSSLTSPVSPTKTPRISPESVPYPPLHHCYTTHLSSSHILHRFLSLKRPADPVLSLNWSLTPS